MAQCGVARVQITIVFEAGARLGLGKAKLLESIRDSGSISAAARDMGMSYKRAWVLLDSINRAFTKPVVTAAPGWAGGGGARLTPFGAELLERHNGIIDRAVLEKRARGCGRRSRSCTSGRTEDRMSNAARQETIGGLRRFAKLALFAALCGCAPPMETRGVAIPQVPAGMARVWFYRENLPYSGFDRPYVRLNGEVVGISELGGAFYRDVSPGAYFVTADTYRHFAGQFPHVDLLPAETAYFQVFEVGGGAGAWKNYARPSYYVWVMPATTAEAAVAHSVFYAGGG
jgi:molybdate transport system regulatory protein